MVNIPDVLRWWWCFFRDGGSGVGVCWWWRWRRGGVGRHVLLNSGSRPRRSAVKCTGVPRLLVCTYSSSLCSLPTYRGCGFHLPCFAAPRNNVISRTTWFETLKLPNNNASYYTASNYCAERLLKGRLRTGRFLRMESRSKHGWLVCDA